MRCGPEREKMRISNSQCGSRKNNISKMVTLSLASTRGESFQVIQTFEFSGPYSELRPAKLTNRNARTK